MNSTLLITLLFDGLILSGIYAMTALGFVIIYRATGVFNFAQGELMMCGAYLFYLFTSTLAPEPRTLGLLWLVILAIAMSAVSLYYYLQVLKRIYIADPPTEAGPIRTPFVSQIVICLIAFSVVLLGCAPNILLAWLRQAIQVVSF